MHLPAVEDVPLSSGYGVGISFKCLCSIRSTVDYDNNFAASSPASLFNAQRSLELNLCLCQERHPIMAVKLQFKPRQLHILERGNLNLTIVGVRYACEWLLC